MAPALAADVGNRRNGTISAWTSRLRRQFVSRFGACVVDADLKHREAALQLESAAHRALYLVRARRDSSPRLLRRHLDHWTSVRKVKEGETTNDLYAFLTTEPNAEVSAVHPKAMPVILTTPEEVETWMTAPPDEALKLQRPLRCGWSPGASRKMQPDRRRDRVASEVPTPVNFERGSPDVSACRFKP
jgi:hypothetical protein